MRRFSVLGVVLMLLAGCHAGLSRDEANQAALGQQRSSTPVTVTSAVAGPLGRFVDPETLAADSRERVVWAVTLRGSFQGSCRPAPAPGQQATCPPATTELIVLDYASGDSVFMEVPAP